MKKLIKTTATVLLVSLLFASCGETGDSAAKTEKRDESSVSLTEIEAKKFKYADEAAPMRDISSTELVKEIKIGWNLGNTLDASGKSTASEIAWGNPKTTFNMIKAVKEAGFNTVRLPVTWHGHLGAAPDYKIDAEWLDRVNEVVDYVLDNDMYCILNTHHEEWIFPTYEKEEEGKEKLAILWTQIAERFKNYDEKLIFEGINEPRMRNTKFEWNGGNEEGWKVVNSLNAVFVETVRASGGNNALRHLMIPPYAASSDPKAYKALTLPENDDKIIVSIHSYTPYNMALEEGGRGQWLPNKTVSTDPIDGLFKGLKETFTDKGIAVIVGEMGARDKNNLAYRVLWADYFIGRSQEYGIPCLFWDNGGFSGKGELFGLLNRTTLEWTFPEIIEAAIKAANEGKPQLAHITDISELDFVKE